MNTFAETMPGAAIPDEALRATQALRCSPGYNSLHASERAELDYHLGRVENVLRGEPAGIGPTYGRQQDSGNTGYSPWQNPSSRNYTPDPAYVQSVSNHRQRNDYNMGNAQPSGNVTPGYHSTTFRYPATHSYAADPFALDPVSQTQATPNDLMNMPNGRNEQGGFQQQNQQTQQAAVPAQPQQPPRPAGTEVLGERARRAMEAVDFPSFVAELIQGTFVAIVDATSQQVREYAKLVADLSQTVDQFTDGNVSLNQARDDLVSRHPQDLRLVLPGPGEATDPWVEPFSDSEDSPAWLNEYGLGGASLTPELVEGPLLNASRKRLGEERMRTLATLVLMGINRIVIDDGQLRARLQFHARAREKISADIVAHSGGQQVGIATRQSTLQSGVSTMVSTVDVNSQADVALKADLVGEVALKFRTETFDLNNFADASIIQTISRHSLTRQNPGETGNPAPTPITSNPPAANQPSSTPVESFNPTPGPNDRKPG